MKKNAKPQKRKAYAQRGTACKCPKTDLVI